MNEDELDTFIAEMTSEGFIEPVFHEDGTVGVRIVPRDDNPLWKEHLREVDTTIASLMEKGLVEITGMRDGEITYGPTELGRRFIEGEG